MTAPIALRSALAFLAALLLSAAAHAQLFRAYLSSTGNDANPCTLPQPCRLLPAALTAVASGGEIWMLDSANYNSSTVTIGKSVSILAVPGAVGSMVASSGPAISITGSSLVIGLRNLVVVPIAGGSGTNGVSMTGASRLTIEHSLFANLPATAVFVSGAGTLRIVNSIFRDNGGYAMDLQNGGWADISGTQMLGNASGGVHAFANTATTSKAILTDCVVSGGQYGLRAQTINASAVARIFATRTTVENTLQTGAGYGLFSQNPGLQGTASITVSGSTITNNYNAFGTAGTAIIYSHGDNYIFDNFTELGSLTAVARR